MNEFDALLETIKLREQDMKTKYNRTLPRFELLNDRWEKATALNFEEGANIYDSSYVFGDVQVGEKTWIGPFTLLDGTGGLKIGSYCNISAGVQIYTHSSLNWVLTGGHASYTHQSTVIGSCVYIGSQSIIDKGVTIGDHSIIAANSYVNMSFDAYSVIAGTPAKCIGKVTISDQQEVTITYFSKEVGT